MRFLMKKNIDFEGFFESALKYLYSAEIQIRDSLAVLAETATVPELQQIFDHHMEETKHQIERIENICGSLGVDTNGTHVEPTTGVVEKAKEKIKELAFGGKNHGMAGLVQYANDTIKALKESKALDFALIAVGQAVEHFEMASYKSIILLADRLGFDDFRDELQKNLDEERSMSEKLQKFAEEKIHFEIPAGAAR